MYQPQVNTNYWYKLDLQAGKTYEFLPSSLGSLSLYNSCGNNILAGSGTSYYYTPTRSGAFYAVARCSVSYIGNFRVRKAPENITCAAADTLALNTAVTPPNYKDSALWYKVSLKANRTYTVYTNNSTSGRYLSFRVTRGCVDTNTYAASDSAAIFTTTAAGYYYFRIRGANNSLSFRLGEVTDNRVCLYAQNIALDNAITPPKTAAYYWYKVNMRIGRTYEIAYSNYGGTTALYAGCGSAELASGSTYQYTAQQNGALFVRAYSSSTGASFKVTEITDNTVCINAQSIALNQTKTPPQATTYYWYKLGVQAGKTYEVAYSSNRGLIVLYDACGGNPVGSSIYTAVRNDTVYVQAYSILADASFK